MVQLIGFVLKESILFSRGKFLSLLKNKLFEASASYSPSAVTQPMSNRTLFPCSLVTYAYIDTITEILVISRTYNGSVHVSTTEDRRRRDILSSDRYLATLVQIAFAYC